MNHTLSNFMSDFILGGLIIAISSMFIRNSKSELGGFIYGALPIGFVYLYLLTYYKHGLKETKNISRSVLIATIFFTIYIISVYCLNDYGIICSLVVSFVIFIILCYIYFKYIKDLN